MTRNNRLVLGVAAMLSTPASAQTVGAYGVGGDGSRGAAGPVALDREIVTFADGVLSGIETASPWSVRTIAVVPESEGVVRAHGGLVYVLTPESGLIRVLGRDGTLIGQAGVDPSLAPVDIAPVGNGELFVTTASDGRVVRLSLGGGLTRSAIDLATLDEPDGAPDPGMMIVDRGRLFVQLRRVDDEKPWMFNERGALAVIDIASGELIDTDPAAPDLDAVHVWCRQNVCDLLEHLCSRLR